MFSQSEIGYFEHTIIGDQDIPRSQVAMYDGPGRQVLHSGTDLVSESDQVIGGHQIILQIGIRSNAVLFRKVQPTQVEFLFIEW